MKKTNFYLFLVAAIIVGITAGWIAAMPRHMSYSRNDTIGGCLPDCQYSKADVNEWECKEYPGCSGIVDNDWDVKQDHNPYEYIVVPLATHCDGGGICELLKDYKVSEECETP